MMETQQDTNATSKFIRDNLRELDEYIVKIDSDIIKFNEYVLEQMEEGLAARGETTHDLLTNLFRAYKSTSDKEFVRYIKDRETEYENGQDITAYTLMNNKAKNRYKPMKQNGDWNSPSEDEAKIIALQAEMKAFKGDDKRHHKDKDGSYRKKRNDDARPPWHFVKPKDNDEKSKDVDGKKYWWCPNHEAWVRHSPEECRGKGCNPNKDANAAIAKDGDKDKDDKDKSPALRMSAALANLAVIEDDDE
jgi:hypothetical protein